MAEPLFTQAQLEARLSSTTVRRIYDDDNDGGADTNPVEQLRKDASSKVRAILGPIYDLAVVDAAQLDEVVRLALDVAQAMAAQRHPEYVRVDGFKLMQQAEKDLKMLRDGVTNLGTQAPPEPAANQGVRIASGDPDFPERFAPKFSDKWGSF